MDYQKIRKQLEGCASGPVSIRQLLSVIAIALMDIRQALAYIRQALEHIEGEAGRWA
ncbi:hypothetical protein [Bifidobacterium vespertilionis]|uniref:hypothetical protein n=1 Tax=Bifidobacterium vespertilionis TaxID=2562524 RepID=UPI001BDD8167|nr:hypothetical protein [Bifidobacterium vespertilionis]MBT1178614.1 hypothetical protein [Bifidobacterium vespertilionis]